MSLTEARWIDIRHNDDARGTLTALEGDELPFPVRRIFYMHRVPQGGERGAHAHRYTQQCLIAVAGAFTVDLSDGAATATYVALDDPNRALYLPVMTWAHLRDFLPGTVALALCDTVYNPAHVVRSWDDYRRLVQEMSPTANP